MRRGVVMPMFRDLLRLGLAVALAAAPARAWSGEPIDPPLAANSYVSPTAAGAAPALVDRSDPNPGPAPKGPAKADRDPLLDVHVEKVQIQPEDEPPRPRMPFPPRPRAPVAVPVAPPPQPAEGVSQLPDLVEAPGAKEGTPPLGSGAELPPVIEAGPAVPGKSPRDEAGAAPAPAPNGALDFPNLPVMLGDQAPGAFRQFFPGPAASIAGPPQPGQPPLPPVPGGGPRHAALSALLPSARGIKIAENQSPQPQDRAFFTYNYYNNINSELNGRIGAPVASMQAYRAMLGLEKTFLDGSASVGLRMPIDTLSARSRLAGLGGTRTALGDLSFFVKKVLLVDQASGSLLSGGLALTVPTGPASFAGSRGLTGGHDAQLQPFLGFIKRWNRLYLQGFSAIDVPTNTRDVTLWYNDVGIGYFAYSAADPNAWLTAIVPTFEVHLNDPLSHRGAFRANDPAGTPDVVDLTYGASFVFRQHAVLSIFLADPITGPRPFDLEFAVLLNIYFGRFRIAQMTMPPPTAGK